MECLLIVRAVCVFLCTTTIAFTSTEQTNNHHESIRSTRDATPNAHYFFYQRSEYPKDCREVQQQCSTSNTSGVYLIKPDSFPEPFEVFCNNNVDTGGWTVIQRRENGSSLNFSRSWSQYKDGFGFLSTAYWLGNEKLSYLTNQALYELRVDITLSNGRSFYTTYKGFRISDEWSQYKVSHIAAPQNNTGLVISVCPTNMIYGNCICQSTCESPKERSGCDSVCSGSEGCICPDGFLMNGSNCIYKSECGCFLTEANLVIPNGEVYVNDDCTQNCACSNNQLSCTDYRCGTDAVCGIMDGVRQCSCSEGYEGDGQTCDSLYTDCKDVYDSGHTQDGVYAILPSGWPGSPFNVSCKMDNGGGWTVFQRRTDDTISFYQNWASYKEGFGDNINFWLGNEKLYYLTNQRNYKLRLDITTSSGSPLNAEFTEFQIESESTNYKMNKLGSRSTSSGGSAGSYLSSNKGKPFSTYDRDNNACAYYNCAEKHRSGWWYFELCGACYSRSSYCSFFQYNGNCYSVCTYENLNGDYNGGNGENIFSGSFTYCNIRSVEMKIRPSS